ncbi:MAG: peptidoglycan DD-metalloendopeptidase family protein [Anaerolineae bacterium]|nr:peptidoglycan DD-metalloendopeptidase family protein [Anaerolineae bacterium]
MSNYRYLIVWVLVIVIAVAILGGLLIVAADVLALPGPTPTPTHSPTATLALPDPTDTPLAVAILPSPSASPTFILFHPVTPSPTVTVAVVNVVPASTPAIITLASTASPTATAGVEAAAARVETPTATYTPLPLVAQTGPAAFREHFIMTRPLAAEYTNFASRNYPYGSTAGGTLQPHHGVDINNPTGTPVRAVADGTVYYAGDDSGELFGPQRNFYGKLIIIDHGALPNGKHFYSLYGHLSEVFVQPGQEVKLYWTIGAVGATGVAQGSHLHFEVRVGDPRDYFAVRNPDLWLQNWNGFGVLAGRVTNSRGEKLPDLRIEIRSPSIGAPRAFTTYADPALPGDDILDENFAYSDLPVGDYEIKIEYPGGAYKDTFSIFADRVTWLAVETP